MRRGHRPVHRANPVGDLQRHRGDHPVELVDRVNERDDERHRGAEIGHLEILQNPALDEALHHVRGHSAAV